jgi:hypothetical protein
MKVIGYRLSRYSAADNMTLLIATTYKNTLFGAAFVIWFCIGGRIYKE